MTVAWAGALRRAFVYDTGWPLRQRLRRTGRRTVDTLPDPGPRIARRLAVAVGVVRPHPLPLVSIVVPVHGVEDYIAECLDTLCAQTHDNLQIILVDDGSPDQSIDIMRAYARRDPRIEIFRRRAGGPGAARNSGIREARGTYLMFVDPDDVLDRDAVATHVTSLQRTGSDFSVAPYRRLSRAGTRSAGWWIQQAHGARRDRTSLAVYPTIQVNAVMWSKCFRRRFWQRHDLAFPEGVLFEDQLVSAQAYALARRFDVLPKPLYSWRVRENQTSITQQISDPDVLRAWLAAAQSNLAFLTASQHRDARDARLVQFLRHDLQFRITAAQHSGDEYWEVLRQGVQDLTRSVDESLWARVSVQQRIAILLVQHGLRAEVIWFTGLGQSNPKRTPAIAHQGRLYLDSPAQYILGVRSTDPVLAFADHQLELITSIRRLQWTDEGRLRITAWAYVDNVSLADPQTPFVVRVWAEPRGPGFRRSNLRVPMTVRLAPSSEVTNATQHRHADYERSGFVAEIDPGALTSLSDATSSVWRVMIEVEAAGIRRSGPLAEPYRSGSAGVPTARFRAGFEVAPRYGPRGDLRIGLKPVRCHTERASLSGRVLSVGLQGQAGFVPFAIELAFPGGPAVRQTLRRGSDGRAEGEVVVPHQVSRQPENWSGQDSRVLQGVIRVVSIDGTRAPAAVLDDAVIPRRHVSSVHVDRTEFGNLCVVDEWRAVRIDTIDVTADHRLLVGGTAVGLDASEVTLVLESPRARTSAPAREQGHGRFEASVVLEHDPWGAGDRPLPSGRYVLAGRAAAPDGSSVPIAAVIDHAVIGRLPITADTDTAHVRLRRAGGRRLRVDLAPPLTLDERGLRRQETLQNDLRRRLSTPRAEPGAVLFRSYYGEIAGCNQLAIHRELRRRDSGHTLYWAVRDRSVRVPDGGIPVIYESAEWYRLLHEAEFYLDNMHQPIYHRKPPHQVQIQTFHGYPFKLMGRSNWTRERREIAHVQSYLDRAAEWDFMVSPATYATEPLREAFGFPHEVLEIGYPRNDVLLGPDAGSIRAKTRSRLGIRKDQCVVLYAPTFRDELAKNDFTAAMVDFLDVDALTSTLGSSHVVLVRGHAFNAREHERIGSAGRVIDVTDYPDVAELMLASDAAVLDYSSLRFDYALTDKPMIFLVPDLERYLSETRGSILPYEPTAPGPLVRSTEEVIGALADLEAVRRGWSEARAEFRRRFADLDDGHASERLVDSVFGR
jgi:CDP-glycerol glycerophosphotransferase